MANILPLGIQKDIPEVEDHFSLPNRLRLLMMLKSLKNRLILLNYFISRLRSDFLKTVW